MIELEFDSIDLDKIYDSGQVFRWKKIDEKEYEIPSTTCTTNKTTRIKQEQNKLLVDKGERATGIYARYFDADTDYSKFHDMLIERNAPNYLLEAEQAAKGIRILRQPLWETIVSFIISQNNNIPRIKKSIQALVDKYGHFPKAEEIIREHIPKGGAVSNCGLGYREEYVVEAAWAYFNHNECNVGYFDTYDNAIKFFKQWKGIGSKVANCICLYGLHHLEAFPRDTWIKRIEQEHFNGHFHDELYPECAGVLQQYMFYYERMKKKD